MGRVGYVLFLHRLQSFSPVHDDRATRVLTTWKQKRDPGCRECEKREKFTRELLRLPVPTLDLALQAQVDLEKSLCEGENVGRHAFLGA